MRRLGNDDDFMLEVPANHDLRRRDTVALGDGNQAPVAEIGRPERAVSLERHAALAMGPQLLRVVQRGAPLDLVHRRHAARRALELVELRDRVVADTDRPREPVRLSFEQALPHIGPGAAARRPVDQPQVDAFEPERGEALLDRLALAPGSFRQ